VSLARVGRHRYGRQEASARVRTKARVKDLPFSALA
jgi:hypothetical protein